MGEDNVEDVRDEFLVQFYSMEVPPKNVMLDEMPADEAITEYIRKKSERKINIQKVTAASHALRTGGRCPCGRTGPSPWRSSRGS